MPPSPPQQTTESTPPSTEQETTAPSSQISEVEARKVANLEAKIAALESQIAETNAKTDEIAGKLKTPNPQETVRNHIRLLHDYNELRDIGTGLMSLIADQRGVRLKEIMAEFGVGEGD